MFYSVQTLLDYKAFFQTQKITAWKKTVNDLLSFKLITFHVQANIQKM